MMAAKLPGFSLTPAVAVGMAAGTVAVLRLPLSAVVIASVLTASSGLGAGPLVIVGVVVAYVVSGAFRGRGEKHDEASAGAPGGPTAPAQAALT